MKKFKKYLENFLPYILVFLSALYRPYDADLGWHLKYGEYFFKYHQILRDNIFSTMMPNYKWPDSDWATDIITYFTYHNLGGFLGLTILSALVVTLTFLFFSKAFKLDYFEKALIFPILVYIEQPINSVSFRGQLISILLLAILFYVVEKYDSTRSRIIYFTIPLFFVWVNFNGQYVLGLGIFAAWIILYLVREFFNNERNILTIKNDIKKLGGIFILTTTATLLNPFGFEIYKVTLDHIGNKYLKDIAEYLPFKESSALWWNQLIIGVLIGVGFLFIFFNGEVKKRFPIFSIAGILYLLSWTVRRYAWSFYYIAIPFLKPLANFLRPDKKQQSFWAATILFLIFIGIILYSKLPLDQYQKMSWQIYCYELSDCSPKSADFIIKNRLNNKLLTLYGWGGWLIWNYPQIKPSIDGRMHLWVDNKGYSAFGDYYAYEQADKNIDNSNYNSVLMSRDKPLYDQLLSLVKEKKWKLIYQDNTSGVFVRNK